MDTKEMEYFMSIAKEGNLTKASEAMLISQPAMSKFLTKLEESYNTKLFTRHGNKLVITTAGQIYFSGARKILDIAKNVDKKIMDISNNKSLSISIGVTGERSQRYLGKLLPLIYSKHPGVHIDVVEYPAAVLRDMVKSNEIDFAIYALPGKDEALSHILIDREEVVLAIPSSHKLAKKGKDTPSQIDYKIPLEALADEDFVLLREGTMMREIENSYFSKHNFSPKKTVETKGTFSSLIFVENGLGIGFCPKNYEFNSSDVKYIGLEDPFQYTTAISYKRGAFLTAPMAYMIQLIKQKTVKL